MIESIKEYIVNGRFSETLSCTICKTDKGLLIPGFVDTHTHMAEHGFFMRFDSLEGFNTKKQLLEFIGDKVGKGKELNIFIDYDDTVFKDEKSLEREDLDKISKKTPIVLRRVCGHVAVLNESAIRYFSGLLRNTDFVEYDTGIAYEYLPLYLFDIVDPSVEEIKEGILKAQDSYINKGIVAIEDFAKDFKVFDAYLRLCEEGKLLLKVSISFYERDFQKIREYGLHTGWHKCKLEVDGIKLFIDGSVGGRTASFYRPYKDKESKSPFYTHSELAEKIRFYENSGFRVLMHAIGERAIDTAVEAVSNYADFGHRVEHFEFPSKKAIKNIKVKKLQVSMQPNFIRRWALMYRDALLDVDFRKMHPYSDMIEEGVNFAFGSDSMPHGPLWGIRGAVRHPIAGEQLDFETAMIYYTAKAGSLLGVKAGDFKKGYFADFLLIENGRIKDVYLGGKRYG